MPLTVGHMLQGRYCIRGLLGQGGMGAVYLAEDTRLSGRRCAVKENLPDPYASQSALAQAHQQFLAEASVLAQLDHPNLPKISDYFSEAGGEYLVMDYVEGEDLDSALQRIGGPLPEKPVLIWADQVLDALTYLHSHRPRPIIHRDIKPANIRLTAQGKVKLVDFGLAKLLDPNDPRTMTALRGRGTPEYAPQEQYAADGTGHTDARSDLYSLGATLYHLLTNTPPPGVHQRLLNLAVLRPLRQLNPRLTENTERAILRALEIYPDQRFQSAAEMRQALRPPAEFPAVTPAPPPPKAEKVAVPVAPAPSPAPAPVPARASYELRFQRFFSFGFLRKLHWSTARIAPKVWYDAVKSSLNLRLDRKRITGSKEQAVPPKKKAESPPDVEPKEVAVLPPAEQQVPPAKQAPPPAVPCMRCPHCGQMIPATEKLCPHCGRPLSAATPPPPAAAAPPKAAHISVRAGPERGKTFTIETETRVGRGAGNDVALSDPRASRRHGQITRQGSQYILVDLGSSYGTFVNNKRIRGGYALKDGDVIKLGETEILFHL